MKKIYIVMGSDSDWPVMKQAAEILETFKVEYEARVVSAHRTPEDLAPFAKECEDTDACCIIAGAGGAAHLPGMLASYTYLPVVGVPVKSKNLDGMDSLLSIVQMPKGVPVATMGINNAGNAALMALKILAVSELSIREKLVEFKAIQKEESGNKTNNLKL